MHDKPRDFDCDVRSYAREWFVSPSGDLDFETAGYLDAVLRLCVPRTGLVAIGCRGLRFVDSAGITVLVRARAAAQELGYELMLAEVPPAMQRVLEVCGVSDAFTVRARLPQIADAIGSPHALIATDLNGVVTHWNAAAQSLYGWSRDQTVGLPITNLTVAPQDERLANEIMEAVRERGVWEDTFEVMRRDGNTFRAHVRETLVLDHHRQPVGLLGLSIPVVAPAHLPTGRS